MLVCSFIPLLKINISATKLYVLTVLTHKLTQTQTIHAPKLTLYVYINKEKYDVKIIRKIIYRVNQI